MATTFVYKVRDNKGQLINGQIEGDGITMVATKLRQMGYVVVELKEKSLAQKEITLPFSNRVKAKDVIIFSRQFATMVSAGLSLTRCLGILEEQTESKPLKKIIAEVLQDVERGKALSEAMAKHPSAFPPIYINMVKAGEAGGVLDTVLHRVAEHFEKEASIKAKIKSAMAYPTAMFAFSILITIVLITFVVPVFVNMFDSMGGQLPLPTKMLLWASSFIRSFWFIIIPALVGAGYGFKYYAKTPVGKSNLDRMKLKLPVFGSLIRKMAVSKFTRTLGTLMASGVPILQALDIVADSSGNTVIAGAVRNARVSIKEGETIAKPLSQEKVFPPMVVQMISVGEETGALDSMLSKIADFYDDEVSSMVDALTSIIEPMMIMMMGGIVGGIIISLYMPMFQVINLIK
ncbi:MAG: type II secretion system F family protein [Firmicutes bacterium]|nr:type II secretion system F family protein [Bacillota bacterium]